MKRTVMLVLCVSVILVCANAYAGTEPNPATKIGRGMVNMATCWIEVPKQICLTSSEYDPLIGLTFGVIKGAVYTVLRGAAGVYDTATFVLPKYNNILMEPEFVFEGW